MSLNHRYQITSSLLIPIREQNCGFHKRTCLLNHSASLAALNLVEILPVAPAISSTGPEDRTSGCTSPLFHQLSRST
ncbi:Protein of unknown function [Pyronema omphalodes CBS 100304]|uniref:Uncharacterized protein n=1 Tax=Pyronema omphalodes (strain CBS 100304) TaxID=1076935 RepID=U4LLU6_PYROM|nr:Protein of unknown function [Pyronema omphalodes CBS 100304]